jgi:CO/xanthine dehydrogenase FAD-binding subunit
MVFLKWARQRYGGSTVICVTIRMELNDSGAVSPARIALGGANEHPMRAVAAEQLLIGQPLDAAAIAAAGTI